MNIKNRSRTVLKDAGINRNVFAGLCDLSKKPWSFSVKS